MAKATTSQEEPLTRPFTEQAARQALTRACQLAGINARPVELIRMGSNAVFRLKGALIARVAPSVKLLANAEKQIEVARWLESVDYPAARASAVAQPVEAEGRVVTFWESVAHATVYAPIGDVAALIRRLHALPLSADIELPELRPFGSPDEELPLFSGLPPTDAHFLRQRIEWARETFPLLPFVLPRGPVHGDANVGNVICDDQGRPVLIDLDAFAMGPREWDLIQTALFADRLGWHSADEYRILVEVYGYDLTDWAGYSALADMREIAMMSWLAKKAELRRHPPPLLKP
ncbi:aminoglycoside phosphotransferase family protein [Pseudonocardia nigra]|uniref:aminoglycoside phosphotransferase family protein n=1 Tax=Pseudonocardia nigra TaxID=1921578 RepID=UPI001FE384E5|nr:aminoglycoside phosphotransferase family protein [Pseudonocardia nigra]